MKNDVVKSGLDLKTAYANGKRRLLNASSAKCPGHEEDSCEFAKLPWGLGAWGTMNNFKYKIKTLPLRLNLYTQAIDILNNDDMLKA